MAVTATPIFAQTPYAKSLTLAAQTACTTRAPTATASLAGANITAFVPTSTNGLRIDSIQVNNCTTLAARASRCISLQLHLRINPLGCRRCWTHSCIAGPIPTA